MYELMTRPHPLLTNSVNRHSKSKHLTLIIRNLLIAIYHSVNYLIHKQDSSIINDSWLQIIAGMQEK